MHIQQYFPIKYLHSSISELLLHTRSLHKSQFNYIHSQKHQAAFSWSFWMANTNHNTHTCTQTWITGFAKYTHDYTHADKVVNNWLHTHTLANITNVFACTKSCQVTQDSFVWHYIVYTITLVHYVLRYASTHIASVQQGDSKEYHKVL